MMSVTDPSSHVFANWKAVLDLGEFTGEVKDLDPAVYHKAHKYLSNSQMKEFKKSPAAYKVSLTAEYEREIIGTAVHMRTLEPQRFDRLLTRIVDRRGGRGTEAKELEAQGRFVVTNSEYETICQTSDAILHDEDCMKILTGGTAETSLFWKDPLTGVMLRGRTDYIRPSDGIIADIKTYGQVSDEEDLSRQIVKMGYHRQAALYLDALKAVYGIESNGFVNIFVTTSAPFTARPVILDDASLEKGRAENHELLKRFRECQETDEWPVFKRPESGLTILSLPSWAW